MSDTSIGTSVPLTTQFKKTMGKQLKDTPSVSADLNRFGMGSLKGKMLDKQPVQDVFTRGFGVKIEDAGTNVQLSGKNLSKEALTAIKKKTGISQNDINKLKKAGKNEAKVVINKGDLATYVSDAGTSKLKETGISIKETKDGLLKVKINGKLSEEQTKLLKSAGISKDAIEELGKSNSTVIKNINKEKVLQKVGKEELSKFAKANGIKIEEITTRSISAGNARFAEKLGLKAGTLYQKVASKFGKEVTEEAVEKFGATAGKSVSKVAAVSARGMAGIPIAGALIMGAFEIPNIIFATKNEGISGGIRQTIKSLGNIGASLVGGSVGGAVGATLGFMIGGPVGMGIGATVGDFIGGVAGYTAGEVITNTIFGKTSTDPSSNSTTSSNESINETNVKDPMISYIKDTSFMDLTQPPYSSTAARIAVNKL